MGNSLGDVKIQTIGEPQIAIGSRVIGPSAQVTFAAGIFLILEARNPISRRRLEDLLWPNASQAQASHRLRQTLLKLRRLGLGVQSVGRCQVKVAVSEVLVDFERWTPEIREPESPPRELLPFANYNPHISAEFSEWLERQRAAIVSIISHGILHKIAQHRLAAEWIAVESWCTSLLQVAPLNEEATLALAEALAMRGAKHSATRLLDDYLRETGAGPADLRVQVSVMRRRIADRLTARSSHAHEADLVGRKKTMENLGQMLRASKRGSAGVCVILGGAGIGKSRVLSELAQFATLQGFVPLRVNARASHQHRPLSTFVQLAPLLRSLPGAIGCSEDTLKFLDLLTKHEPRRHSNSEALGDSAWIFSAVQTALFDLIDAVSDESPLLIQLEDMHWVDSSSCDVLRELIQRLADRRVFFALTAREMPEGWQSSPPIHLATLTLDPLSILQATELVSSLMQNCGRRMETSYVEWCVNVAEGNPYFLTELTNHWIETGIEHQVPASLNAILRRRLSRLQDDALQVLQTCALLENNSTLPRIEAVLEQNAHDLLRNINSLGMAGMIVSESPEEAQSGGERLASRHELLSNVALMQLTPPARRFLHRRIGKVLEAEIDDHYSAATLWDCAKHWQLAGDHAHAWHLATSCAAHLMKIGLPTAAAQAYQQSLNFCSTDNEKLDVLSAQAVAFYSTAAWGNLRDTIAKVRLLQRRCCPGCSEHDEFELMDLRAQWQSLKWDTILTTALGCLRADNASASHRCEAGVMGLMLLGFQGDPNTMREVFQTIEDLSTDPCVTEATKLQARMVFHTNLGNLDEAVLAARALVNTQQSKGDIGELFRALCNAGVTCRVGGLFSDASSFFSSALTVASKHNLQAAEQRAIPLAANMALEIGNIDDARRLYERLCRIPLDPTDRFAFLERQALAERLALCDGRTHEARELVPMTYAEAASDPIHHRRTYNLALFIVAELAATGRVDSAAVKLLEESFAISRSGVHQAFNAFVLYAALRKTGRRTHAGRVLETYRSKYRREPWPAPEHLLQTILRSCGVS